MAQRRQRVRLGLSVASRRGASGAGGSGGGVVYKTPAVVQLTSINMADSSPGNVSLTGVAAGNMLILIISHSEATTNNAPSSITGMTAVLDAVSNNAVLNPASQYPSKTRIYREYNTSAGAKSVTVTFVGEQYGQITLVEVSNCLTAAALDKTATSGSGSGLTMTSATTAALSQPGEIVFASVVQASTSADGADSISLPPGYTLLTKKEVGVGLHHCYKVVTATTAVNAVWTSIKTDNWTTAIATYKAQVGP